MVAIKKPAPGAARSAPAKKKSRFIGIKPKKNLAPLIPSGTYTGEYLGTVEDGGWRHNKFRIVDGESTDPNITVNAGDELELMSCSRDVKTTAISDQEMFALFTALTGLDPDTYNAFDPEGQLWDHAFDGTVGELVEAGATLIGRHVVIVVRRGKPTPDGDDYYRDAGYFASETQPEGAFDFAAAVEE